MTFGFVATSDDCRLIYQQLPLIHLVQNKTLIMYGSTQNLSEKLFHLIWDQLLIKRTNLRAIRFRTMAINSNHCNENNRNNGVYIYKMSNLTKQTAEQISIPLINKLLQLPNQFHCCFSSIGDKHIWILNNNGRAYDNINWQDMDWKILVSKLNHHTCHGISNCIEYCIKNNQFIFLKKVLHFLTKFHDEANTWPKFREEHIIMQLRKYNKIIDNHTFFINQFVEIYQMLCVECEKNNTMHNISSLFSTKIDNFVKTVIIPATKLRLCKITIKNNIIRLKQQTHWRYFICKRCHKIDIKICPNCENNKQFYKLNIGTCVKEIEFPVILSLNPYHAFIENESTLFNIDKWFGVIQHRQLKFGQSKRINSEDFQCQRRNGMMISVICDFQRHQRITILFDARNALSVGELKIIIYELMSNSRGNGKCRVVISNVHSWLQQT